MPCGYLCPEGITAHFSIQKSKEAKAIIYKALDHLELPYVKPSANFVFFKSGKHIDELGAQMLNKGIMIGRAFPPFFDWCRISTGTIEETELFAQNLVSLY